MKLRMPVFPDRLRGEIDKLTAMADVSALAGDAGRLSSRYRHESGCGKRLLTEEREALAYAAVRMPAKRRSRTSSSSPSRGGGSSTMASSRTTRRAEVWGRRSRSSSQTSIRRRPQSRSPRPRAAGAGRQNRHRSRAHRWARGRSGGRGAVQVSPRRVKVRGMLSLDADMTITKLLSRLTAGGRPGPGAASPRRR